MASKTYIDSTGLSRFLADLKTAYSTGKTGFTVKYAQYADGDTNTIQNTYETKTHASSTYIPLSATFAGLTVGSLDDGVGITKSSLLTALNVADGAQVNVLEGISFKGNGDSAFADLTITNKKAILDLSGYALKSEVAKVMDYKGSKTADELAAIKAGTITADMNGDVYTCSTESSQSGATDFKAGFEYVAVVSGTSTLTLNWVELGKNFAGLASETWVSDNFVGQSAHNTDLAGIQSNIDDIYKAGTPAQGDPEDPDYVPAVPESGVLVTKVNAEKTRAEGAESALASRLTTLEGADTVTGSVAKSIKDAIGALDYGITGASGQQPAGDFVTGVTETDGIIAVSRASYSTMDVGGATPATATNVKNYVDTAIQGVNNAVAGLDLAQVGQDGKYIKLVSQTDGQVAATAADFDTTIGPASGTGAATDNTAPTSKAVRTLVDSVTVGDGSNGIITEMVPMSNNDIDALFN